MSFSRWLLRLVLGPRRPITAGTLRVQGLKAPVTIRRDRWGIPHIDAATEADAYFALGFCQGQDRAAQLEIIWRLVRGRLAEWVGPAAVMADRMSRRIGFFRAGQAQVPVLVPEVHDVFHAFAAGMTAGASVGLPRPPHEFAILGGEPSAWTTADVLGAIKLQSFLLPSNWDVELARLRILLADGPEALAALDPLGAQEALLRARPDPSDSSEASGSLGASLGAGPGSTHSVSLIPVLDRLAADLAALQAYFPRGGGSNNWAIAGSRTQSGQPLLASDPHLAPTCPPPWYLAHVRTPAWEVAGATLAGTPGFAIGHNGFCAWGVTAALTDNTDLFIETLSPDGKAYRQADGTFTPCEVVKEVIRVKNAPDVVEEVLLTPRGPILSPLWPDIPLALALAATWLQARPLTGFYGAPRARSFHEFRQHFAQWPALPLNVVYADAAGTIAWQLTGEIPHRHRGYGLLPQPADRPQAAWDGVIPFDEMPWVVNPTCGYLATANDPTHQIIAAATPAESAQATAHWLGADFIDDFRAQRIRELLAHREHGWTVPEVATLQRDVQSLPWRQMREKVLSLQPQDADAQLALRVLRDWDGQVHTESPAAAVYELFVAEMCQRVAKAQAPTAWPQVVGESRWGMVDHNLFIDRRVGHLVWLLREQPSGWFASWSAEMEAALGAAVRSLRRWAGPGVAFWAWGHLRRLRLEHPLLGQHRWLGAAFNLGPIPWGGDANTISQAAVRPANPTAFTHNIANLRAVFDLSNPGLSTFVLCGGQSGNPASPHYADLLPLWQRGEAIVIPWDQPAVIRATVDTLRLLPPTEPGADLPPTEPGTNDPSNSP
ncbi:MAG: penicillin acylase family protein [Gemmataceae bacterium]|nr:penicillin acylase family protein [Gemmata sp.]MDW8198260.1 penicillin acylase family protein [Gemmataceae bacterium]